MCESERELKVTYRERERKIIVRERKIRIKERQEREQAKEVDAKRRRTQVGSDDNLNKSNRVRPRVQIPSTPSTLFSICIEIVTSKERK